MTPVSYNLEYYLGTQFVHSFGWGSGSKDDYELNDLSGHNASMKIRPQDYSKAVIELSTANGKITWNAETKLFTADAGIPDWSFNHARYEIDVWSNENDNQTLFTGEIRIRGEINT